MKHTTEFDTESGICTVFVTGILKRPDDSIKLQRFAREFGSKNNCNLFLFDLRKAEINGSLLDTYTAATVPEDVDKSQVKQKIALVYNDKITEEEKFLENVAVNRGYNLRVFNQLEEAMKWLTMNK